MNNNIRTLRRQYKGHDTPLGYHTDQGPYNCGQYDGQGVNCCLGTASEVFPIFTTLEGSIGTGILPTPNTPLSSLPVGSKTRE